MAASSKTSNKKRKREPSVDARITYHAPSKSFERLFQEHSLEDLKRVVRRKLGLADDLDVQLTQIRGNSFIVLEDEDDFEAFRIALEANSLVEMRVSVTPRDEVSQPAPLVPKPIISPILPEMPPPTKKRKTKSDSPQKALVSTTDASAVATTTMPTNKDSRPTHATLNASAQLPVPLPTSRQTLTEDQQPNAPNPKLKPKRNLRPISSPPPPEDTVNSIPSLGPIASETLEKKQKITRKTRQSQPEPGPQNEEGSAFVTQIINSVRTGHRTPQAILAAFNSTNSNQTARRSSRVPNPSALVGAVQPRKLRSPIKTLPTPAATPLERSSARRAPELAVQQLVSRAPLACPICSKEFHIQNQCPELAQRAQALCNKRATDHPSNKPNPETETEKQGISNLLVSSEPQSSVPLFPPSIRALHRSEITVQSPGEGSSSPPSSAHEQSDDSYDEMDAAEPLLELSAKNMAANLVLLSPPPVPARPSSEMDEMSNEDAKVESESSENDEKQVALLVSNHVRHKSPESYCSKPSSEPNDTPSPASQKFALTAPPVVQRASLTRAWSKRTSPPLSPTAVVVHLPPEVPELPVIKKLKSPILHSVSVAPSKVEQSQDEELEPTQILHHAVNTSAPSSPVPRPPRPSQSLPRLSILPRTMTRLLLPKSTTRLVPTTPNPDRDDDEDFASSDDDSSDSDNQSSKHIPANQQAGSRPAFRRHRNVLASF